MLELEGLTFEKLKVLKRSEKRSGAHRMWDCLCECGKSTTVRGSSLSQGYVGSCGCLIKERGVRALSKHGYYYHSAYATWNRIMMRCCNPSSEDYAEYGARGIGVAERWKEVANFIADMGERPPKASIDRIDNSKGYEPGNCRWSNPIQQANNTRKNVRLEYEGKSFTLAELARHLQVPYKNFHHYVRTRGMSVDEAVATIRFN